MKQLYPLLFFFSISITSIAQTAIVKGKITDEKDNSPMIGVNVKIKGTTTGMSSDLDGNYELKVPSDRPFSLEYTYVGYQNRTIDFVALRPNAEKVTNVMMTDVTKEMEIVVITGSKFEKKLGEETVSLDVLKGQNITQSNQSMSEAVNKVPGVNMIGNRNISIRGGSGFADGTSNRVLVLIDDIPMVSPENGGIRWEAMPVEAINQMEITKGAASASYGSSALNGLINMRTISPKIGEPFTKIYTGIGVYDHHSNRDFYWFNRKTVKGKERYDAPVFGNVSIVHASRIGNVDMTTNIAFNANEGYALRNSFERVRGFMKLKYVPTKLQNLAMGVMMNVSQERNDDFFLYKGYNDYPSKNQLIEALNSSDQSLMQQYITDLGNRKRDSFVLVAQNFDVHKVLTINVNPYINYYDKWDNRHTLRVGYYFSRGQNTSGDTSQSHKIFGDYSFSKRFKELDLNISTGISGYYTNVNSITFGERFEANAGWFFQFDKKFFKRLTVSGGVRLEYFKLDTTSSMNEQWVLNKILNRSGADAIKSPVQPLFRIGLNYQATEGTFLRASFGQGYRFPSIAEKFVETPRSGAYAVPNFNLRPESGWSAELGIKQGVKISKWMFYADVAGFVNRYRDLIEFVNLPKDSAPVPVPPTYFIIAQAQNYTKAMIMGFEFSTIGTGKIYGVPLNFLIGYTFMEPWNLNAKQILDDPTAVYLNFRMLHSAKADIQTEYKGFIVGATATYTSQMKRIDPQFNIISPIRKWRENHTKGIFVLDVRAGYNWHDKLTATAIIKNVTNTEYAFRPGFVEAPRNYTLQVTYAF
jgi:outer membrane receptor protein involved in Fe transport